MNLCEFFIRRPVFATILNLLLIIVGVLSYQHLTVREYPQIVTPSLSIKAVYPNASAEVVESSVIFPLEDALAGLENLETIRSNSVTNHGKVTLIFKPGTSLDTALSNVRDHLARVNSKLPKGLKPLTVEPKGSEDEPFLHLTLASDTASHPELTHYAHLNLKNTLRSVKDVASVEIKGPHYTMAVALDRLKLFSYGINPDEVINSLKKSQASLPAGKFQGETPINLTLPLSNVEDFRNTVIREQEGAVVLLKDIAEVTLQDEYKERVRVNGQPGVMLGIVKSSDGNPLEISSTIHDLLPDLQKQLPEGMKLSIYQDDANFIRTSLSNIESAIFEATVLVILIIFLFLRNLRSTLIPLITIPISLIGTLALLRLFGFSINTITLLAMVLSVGIVVDDAIVVLENIYRHVEEGMDAFSAAIKGSKELVFAIIAMTLTLASVYAPIAFIKGAIGQLFIEFALTLAGAVIVSGIVALTLSPMMCSRILKASETAQDTPKHGYLTRLTQSYQRFLKKLLLFPKSILAGALVLFAGSALLYTLLPDELTPPEDRGMVGIYISPLESKSTSGLDERVQPIAHLVRTLEEVKGTTTFVGEWGASIIAPLTDWKDRDRSSFEVVEELRERFKLIPSLGVWPWTPKVSLPGVSKKSKRPSELSLSIKTLGSYPELYKYLERLKEACLQEGFLENFDHNLELNQPGFTAEIDRSGVARLNISAEALSSALETMLSSNEALQFKKDTVLYDVTLKAKEKPLYLSEIYLTTDEGQRIALSSFIDLVPGILPGQLKHYNQMRAASIRASLYPGQTLTEGDGLLEH